MNLVHRVTPVLIVSTIQPSLEFWQRLGFELSSSVPHGDALGFVILRQGTAEVMLQSVASLRDDFGRPEPIGNQAALYLEVLDLDAVLAALGKIEIFLPRRRTFYGATEVGVVEPGGHHITFAQFS